MADAPVVALLRGVNIGKRRLAMADLRARLTEVGCEDVRTYVQSGNVVLRLPRKPGRNAAAWLAGVFKRKDPPGTVTTVRNWNTVLKLASMAGAPA